MTVWIALAALALQDPVQDEIRKLIPLIGSDDLNDRERAKDRLLEIGEPALEPLRKAQYHDDAEVRFQAKELLKLARKALQVRGLVAPVREGVRKARARWAARDFDDFEAAVRKEFLPVELAYVHYVPKKELGDHLESDSGVEGRGFRPLGAGGKRDLLTPVVAAALEKNDGLVFLKSESATAEHGDVFLFTLPDRKGWSAYVVAQSAAGKRDPAGLRYDASSFNTRLLASTENRQVWGMDPKEVDWAAANLDSVLDGTVTLSPHASGGLKIDSLTASTILAARGLLAGDIVRDMNGHPLTTLSDLKTMLGNPQIRQTTGLRLTVERAGRPVVLEYRLLPR